MATQSRRLPVAVFGVIVVIAGLIFPYSQVFSLAWLGCVVAVLVGRYAILSRLPLWTDWPLAGRLHIATVLSAVNGIIHGASLIWFPVMTDVERAVQSMIFAGLCSGAIASTAGNRQIYLAYALPILVPMAILWATHGAWSWPSLTDAGLAFAIVMLISVLVMLARDTERQFLESIRVRKGQEALNGRLQVALQAAGVADRAKTRFLAAASHDLRQPIHALSLFGAALRAQSLPPAAQELAENIEEAIDVLASQLDALLDISKLDAGVIRPNIAVIDLTSMLRRIGREFEPQAHDKGLSMQVVVADDLQVRSDKLLLERVVRNLLNNAVRYTEQGGITIEAVGRGATCQLAVVDTGIGIPVAEQRRIFDEFYQVSHDGAGKQGLGLGLSIVTRLLGLLDSPLTLTSVPGEGTRIEVSLQVETAARETIAVVSETRLSGIRVLVIDDDKVVRSAMLALLTALGAEPTAVANIQQAIGCVRLRRPDLVLADLRLGAGETGIEAITQIRELCCNVPAILITGDTGTEQIRLAHQTGLDVIHKPVNPRDLEQKITTVLAGS